MCCICGCLASVLDLIQRTITFVLACWLACVVCLGLALASAAGIAYGYNYSLAEFLSLTRSDVTVYLRRGKFYDTPDLKYKPNFDLRSGDEPFDGDEFTANLTAEHEEDLLRAPLPERRSLSEAWVKAEDTRRYAEWLTKYRDGRRSGDESTVEPTPPPSTIARYYVVTSTQGSSRPIVSRTTQHPLRTSSEGIHFKTFTDDATRGWRPGTPPSNAWGLDDEFKRYYNERRFTTTPDENEPDIIIKVADRRDRNEYYAS